MLRGFCSSPVPPSGFISVVSVSDVRSFIDQGERRALHGSGTICPRQSFCATRACRAASLSSWAPGPPVRGVAFPSRSGGLGDSSVVSIAAHPGSEGCGEGSVQELSPLRGCWPGSRPRCPLQRWSRTSCGGCGRCCGSWTGTTRPARATEVRGAGTARGPPGTARPQHPPFPSQCQRGDTVASLMPFPTLSRGCQILAELHPCPSSSCHPRVAVTSCTAPAASVPPCTPLTRPGPALSWDTSAEPPAVTPTPPAALPGSPSSELQPRCPSPLLCRALPSSSPRNWLFPWVMGLEDEAVTAWGNLRNFEKLSLLGAHRIFYS